MLMKLLYALFPILLASQFAISAQDGFLVEAEAFSDNGGWVVDQQFTHQMGSSYLLAHGYGHPVINAKHTISTSDKGNYNVWIRTMDWVPSHPATPGMFQLKVNDEILTDTFGLNDGWNWVKASQKVQVTDSIKLELIDLTGFEGRCDAIYLTKDDAFTPPNELSEMKEWRRVLSGLSATPPIVGSYNLVVVGGGMAGTAAAIAAARGGIKVALVQDRPVLGGNTSEEVRVHTLGQKGFKITPEIDGAITPWGGEEYIGLGERRMSVVEAEENITLYLSTRAFAANTTNSLITSIDAKHIETGEEIRIEGDFFVDATGDGWIGYWAGAEYMIGVEEPEKFNEPLASKELDGKSHNLRNMMGSSIYFYSKRLGYDYIFPEVPWAMDVAKTHADHKGDWKYEAGIGLNSIDDAEYIRDHLFRAIYGMFYNQKQKAGNNNLDIDWAGYIMGKRESRRLVGDHILVENDVRTPTHFEDSVVYETRAIDIHYLQYPDTYDWRSEAQFVGVPKYWIPFRSLYSKNISNLMMAGRCASFSHIGLGSPRVMNTGAQMGVATGYAAALCVKHSTNPRGIYQNHISELQDSVGIPRDIRDDFSYVVTVDDSDEDLVERVGDWTYSTWGSSKYGKNYYHDGNSGKGDKEYIFKPQLEKDGEYKLFTRYTASSNRSSKTPITIKDDKTNKTLIIDQQQSDATWIELGTYSFSSSNPPTITISNEGTDGYVIADVITLGYNEPAAIEQHPYSGIKFGIQNIYGEASAVFHLPQNEILDISIYNTNGQMVHRKNKIKCTTGINIYTIPLSLKNNTGTFIIHLQGESIRHSEQFNIR